MRRLRYCVATSLDGFIADPNEEYDWIVPDPAINFAGLWAQFDTVLMGRKTYEVAKTRRSMFSGSVSRWIVASDSLNPAEHPEIEVINADLPAKVAALKAEQSAQPGKDIWLFGGGQLFRTLLNAGLVDSVELTVMPTLLGSGVPLLAAGQSAKLKLVGSKALPSGILQLVYTTPA